MKLAELFMVYYLRAIKKKRGLLRRDIKNAFCYVLSKIVLKIMRFIYT